MTAENIQIMLKRFYEAETTPAEEAALRQYFSQPGVPEALQADAALFSSLGHMPAVPQGLEQRLERSIDQWHMVEQSRRPKAPVVSLKWITGIAASIVVCLVLSNYMGHRTTYADQYAASQETYDNPRDAAAQTARALTMFSTALNKGLKKMNSTEKDNRR